MSMRIISSLIIAWPLLIWAPIGSAHISQFDLNISKSPTHTWGKSDKENIIFTLMFATEDELNQFVSTQDLDHLATMMNHQNPELDYDEVFYQVLAKDRSSDLTIENRWKVIKSLQYGPTTHSEEKRIVQIIENTFGDDLTYLKYLIDHKSKNYNLNELVFDDVDDEDLQQRILAHFDQQARQLNRGELKVLSDVDDTYISGSNDPFYPENIVYPGYKTLLSALDHVQFRPLSQNLSGDITFITARPRLGGWGEQATYDAIKKTGMNIFTLILGSISTGFDHHAIAQKKLENFITYQTFYPEYQYIWFGDTSQGDMLFGAQILKDYPDHVRAVFIHDLGNIAKLSAEKKAALAQKGVYIYQTPLGAALMAFKQKLIDRPALENVLNTSKKEFSQISFETTHKLEKAQAQLKIDISKVEETLGY